MKPIIPLVSSIALVLASAVAVAQSGGGAGGAGGAGQGGPQSGQQQQQQQQQRQAERSMTQQGTLDHDRLQTRDRDRTQDQTQTQTQDQTKAQEQARTQEQQHAAGAAGAGIYGGNLMTAEERTQYRKQFGALTTDLQRNEFAAAHRTRMQARSKERGIEPQLTNE
ncbi:MAG: hypothetical protein KA020_17155 [Planctomycetes bacterium]|nr:hypothetical protein [Planctomycetota bacterium]MCC7201028.1 hypothetical protein [Gammaproteobacteria bacterium]